MQFDMVCVCGAGFQLDIMDDDNMLGAWLLIHRFTNAHVKCGFMTAPEIDIQRSSKQMEIKEKNEP